MPMTVEQLQPYRDAYAAASLHPLPHTPPANAALEAVIRLAQKPLLETLQEIAEGTDAWTAEGLAALAADVIADNLALVGPA